MLLGATDILYIGQPTYNRQLAEIDPKAMVLMLVLVPLGELE